MNWPRLLGSRSGDSDEQIMRRLKLTGDHAAFADLMDRWEIRIRRLCYRMTGDEHRREDLTQETFSRVFSNRKQFDASRKFSTWLWRIALNLCYEEARRVGRRGELRHEEGDEPAIDPATDVGPLDRAVQSERVELLKRAVLALPETHRAIVMLREYEQLKFREIAEVLELPEGTVKWRMTESLSQLNEQLKSLSDQERSTSSQKTARPKERLLL